MVTLINNLFNVNVLKFRTIFSFCSQKKCRLSGLDSIHKMHGRIANREDSDQTASQEAV